MTLVAVLLVSTACGADGAGWYDPPDTNEAGTLDKGEIEEGPHRVVTDEVAPEEADGAFGGGTLHYPKDGSATYGVVAAAPGLGADRSMVAWFGDLLASHGFVVLSIDTLTREDTPDERAGQLLEGLDHVVTESPAADRADPTRLGVLGHSMGGGGALAAASGDPDLDAVVALTPYDDLDRDRSDITAATLVIGATDDHIAPVEQHAEPMYEALTGAAETAYLALTGDHFVANSPSPLVTEQVVAWTKRFVNDDKAASDPLCPPPADTEGVVEARGSCPHK